jgi:hypothetical protein
MTSKYRADDTVGNSCKKYGLGKKAMRHFSPLKGWIVLSLSLIVVVTCVWFFTRAQAAEVGVRTEESGTREFPWNSASPVSWGEDRKPF